MASHEPRVNNDGVTAESASRLDELLPVDASTVECVSWELGDRLTRDGESRRVATLEKPAQNVSLDLFEATGHTYIVRFRTPVGREKFYGVAHDNFDVPTVVDDEGWTVVSRET